MAKDSFEDKAKTGFAIYAKLASCRRPEDAKQSKLQVSNLQILRRFA
ncbi:MAG: hypothetical protein KIG95_03585 [Comamonas sp.]|nr:hypothetical protein [Comamonas sp.]